VTVDQNKRAVTEVASRDEELVGLRVEIATLREKLRSKIKEVAILLLLLLLFLPWVLSHCWLGALKSIRPVKNWLMRCWRGCVCSEVQMFCIWSSWCHWHPIISCFIKIPEWLIAFWCWIIQVVLEKRPLNGCLSVCYCYFPALYNMYAVGAGNTVEENFSIFFLILTISKGMWAVKRCSNKILQFLTESTGSHRFICISVSWLSVLWP